MTYTYIGHGLNYYSEVLGHSFNCLISESIASLNFLSLQCIDWRKAFRH